MYDSAISYSGILPLPVFPFRTNITSTIFMHKSKKLDLMTGGLNIEYELYYAQERFLI